MTHEQSSEQLVKIIAEMKEDIILNIQTEIKKELESSMATLENSMTTKLEKSLAEMQSSQLEMKKELESSIAQIRSEVRSRYYDMQNLAYAGHSISDPGYVSTAAAVGRSPRRHINSYDTFH